MNLATSSPAPSAEEVIPYGLVSYNWFEYDSNVLQYSQKIRLGSYRFNLHISSCLTKKENCKITHIGKFCGLNNYAFVRLGDSLAYQASIANPDIYKCSFSPETICKYTVREELWTFRTLDVSYPRRFVPRLDDSYPAVWTFRTQSMDDSYPSAGRFVPKGWTFRTQWFFFLFSVFDLVFSLKLFIQPNECWSIRTHVLFISHAWFDLLYMYLCT